MLAYKTHIKIKGETLFLKIPDNFKGKNVEIIVLETNDLTDTSEDNETFYDSFLVIKDDDSKKKPVDEPNDFQKFLLSSPTWTDNEYEEFLETRKLLSN